jgi:uncharacterized protein (DUF2147 family)
MRHRTFAATLGLLAALVVAGTQSYAAIPDPVGIWLKEDGSAKMEIKKCGKGLLCSKIVWLKEPNDSTGKPLHDARNEDPSMRDRPIMGLLIFSGLAPGESGTWTGEVYNPEDGHTYAVTLTLASKQQVVLRGCKAWLLCGEKVWTRSELAPAPAAEPQEIEAPAAAKPEAPSEQAAGEPQASPAADRDLMRGPEVLTPALPKPSQDARAGFGFVMTTASPEAAPPFSSENVSSMFVMTKPFAQEAASSAAVMDTAVQSDAVVQEPAPIPLPDPKPKPRTAVQAEAAPQAEAADSAVVPVPLTRREQRRLRRRKKDLPWLQHP